MPQKEKLTVEKLKQLGLTRTGFKDISSLKELTNLTQLDLSNNHLTKIPDKIGDLKTLQVLWLNDNYLEEREYVRIDLAAYDRVTDQIIFVEAETGLYLQHPQIYLPFCNSLYILCPEDQSSFRDDQMKWSDKKGIGVIEINQSGDIIYSLNPQSRRIFPAVQAFVKSRLFKRIEKERKKNVIADN